MPDIHFRAWGKRLTEWVRGVLRRWWYWFFLLPLYKLSEDRILSEANGQLEGHTGFAADAARRIVDVLPYLTWLFIPMVIAYLLYRSYLDSKPVPETEQGPSRKAKPRRVVLEHDGMEWEYDGRRSDPKGPFCPDDHTPLAFINTRTSIDSERVVPYYHKDQAHMGGYWGYLECLTCHKEYGKDGVQGYKTVEQSQKEVRNLFDGMENRGEV
jgi:hypothetical protein